MDDLQRMVTLDSKSFFDLIARTRREALEEAAKVCEERAGMRGTGAWTALTAAAEAIRALIESKAPGS